MKSYEGPIEPTEEVIRVLADSLLRNAMDLLSANGEIMPVVFLYHNDGKIDVIGCPAQANEKERSGTYSIVAMKAHTDGDVYASIMINDAYMKTMPGALDNYKRGDLSKDPEAVECIIAGCKGPTMKPFVIQQPYRRGPTGEIEWLPRPEIPATDVQINLMPSWWE